MKQVWKRIIAASTAVFASANCTSWTGSIAGAEEYDLPVLDAEGSGIAINATNFPDVNLRNAISEFDYDEDNYLSDDEIPEQLAIYDIGSSESPVTLNTKGLELFENLSYIEFSDSFIKGNLDLSNLRRLNAEPCECQ